MSEKIAKWGKKVRVETSVIPSQAHLLDSMVGTIYGETRAEVVRFILMSWTTKNIEAISRQIERRKEFDRQRRKRVV